MLEVTEPRQKKPEAPAPVVEEVPDEEEEEEEEEEIPTHEVVEGDTVNLTIERPSGTDVKQTFLLQNDKKLQPNERLTIKPVSSTTTEIIIEKVKLNDEGLYSIQFGNKPTQKLINLKVLPKPVVHDSLHLPKDVFDQGETLTIQCDFEKKPDEALVWKLNDVPLTDLNDHRVHIETANDGKSYTLTVKDLRPKEHQGVYKLENSHLILETPFVRVIENIEEEQEETTILVEDEETESFELQRKPKPEEEEQPQPEEEKPQPEEVKPQPEEVKPQPEEEKPQPEEEKPQPQSEEVKPQPEEEKPKPEEEKPKPEEEKPKPEEEKPQPQEEKPKPEEEKPKEEKPPEEQPVSEPVPETQEPTPEEEVKLEEQKPQPKFVKDLKPNKTTLTEGEQLTLECELDSPPTSVQLLINGQPIPEDRVKTEVKGNKIKFTVDNINLDEAGNYTVKVNEEVESKPVSITVNADIPKFVKNLTINKKQFDAGETLNFECTLNKPFDDIVWLKDGQPIEEDAHIQFTKDGPKLKLTIKDAQPQDQTGTYSVRVKEAESDKVPVTVTKKVPKFLKDLKPNKTTLTEGEQLTFECELDTPPTTVQLFHNGQPIPEDRVKVEIKDKKIKFTLDNIKLDETGDYTVKVNDEVDSKPVSITVNADIPKFVKNLTINKKQFDLGETLNFECTLNKPFDEIVWLKDGQPIEEDAHIQFTKDGPKLKLTIKDAQPQDHTGTYSVRVKEVESDKVPVTVTKKVPKFVKDLKANKTTLTEGEQLTLECELDMPPTSVQLLLNGEPVREDRIKPEIKDKKIKFTLDNIKLDEAGNYTVKVNEEVESKPVLITVNADIPKFVKNLTINKKQFDLGETLNFECTLNKPFDEIVWLKDGQPIEEDAHIQFTKDGPKLKLTIKDAQPQDHTGTYSVRVKEVESDKVPVTVTKKVPKFVKDLKANKTTLTEGEQLTLECELDMPPTSVQLFLNGEPLSDDRIKPEIKDKKIKFTLDNIQLNESGDYTVKVNDEVDSKPVSITVNEDIPKFVKNLTINKKQFEIGETLNFECTLNKPFDDIVWLKDGQPIEEDAHIQFTKDGPKLKLTIKDARPEDHTGTYSVRVKNVESDKVPVVVQEKPLTFDKDLKAAKTTVDENDTVEFSCQLSRPLKPDEKLQWFHNNVELPIDEEYPNEQINLQIPDVQPTASGEYYLQISSPDQKKPLKSSSVKITVKPEEIKFIKPLRALKNPLNEDETLTLECELDKPNYRSVVFFFNNKPLNENEDDRIKITQTGNKWQVKIINVKQETDEGEYTVTVNEKVSSPSVKVTIIKPLTFVQDLTVSNAEPVVDDTITFECELSRPLEGVNSKDISFTLNGKLLSNDQTKRLKIEINSTSPKIRLTLVNVKLNVDQGNYQLKLLHPQELQSQTVAVTIKPKPIEVIQPLQAEKSENFEDDTLVLSTKLKNVPENPSIVWLRDDQPLTIDNKRIRSIPSRDGQQFKLSIENTKLDQSGTYALQINDEIITKCDVEIKAIPLKTVVPLKIIGTPVVGGNVELQIEINRPNVPFVWLKDDIPLENQPTPNKDQTKYRLKLSDLTLDDSGTYSIRFNDGELEEKVNLTVALPPFEFIEQLKCLPSDDVEEDSDVTLQAVLNRPIDDTNIPITVLKNNKPLSSVEIQRDGPTLRILLKNVKSDDAGTYKVTIDKTKDSTARLKVHDKPLVIVEQLHLVNPPNESNTIEETSPFELFIRYNKPIKNVVLNQNTKRVPFDKHVQINYEDDSTAVRIRFDAAQLDDKGKYDTTVKDSTISNRDGLRSETVTIDIKSLPILFTSDIEVSAKDKDNIPEKNEITLTTTINLEKGKVKWFFNDKEIKDDQNHKIVSKNLQRQLIIKSTTVKDSGVYTVKTDDDQRTIEITIKDDIRFVKELTPKTSNIVEGKEKEVVFECETSKSTPVQWFHDDEKLSPTEMKKHYQMESTKNNTVHKLRILQPVTGDSGVYRCVLPSNVETNAQLTVEQAGTDFLQQLTTPVHVEFMKSALLECELSKKPQKVVWKNQKGQPIDDSDKYEIMNNGKLQGLIINDCDDNDAGSYTITIDDNKSSTAEIIVDHPEEKLKSPQPEQEEDKEIPSGFAKLLPKQLETNEDDDFVLECEVKNPEQITDWYLDDDLIDKSTPRFEIINNGTLRKLIGSFRLFENKKKVKYLFFFLVHKAELNDTGKYTCSDRQSGLTTDCDVSVTKAPIRIIKGLPETVIVPQGKKKKEKGRT